MTTGMTLFGGLAAVVTLFGALRMFKTGAELAGLVAAGVPLLVYFIMLFGNWPGLDVVAIHISVFVAAAFILAVFSRYRAKQAQTQQGMHWVPKLLIAFFVLLAVINSTLLYLSTNGLPAGMAGLLLPVKPGEIVHTGFSGITRHGEEAAKSIGAALSQQHYNTELGWQVSVEGLKRLVVGTNALSVHVEDRDSHPLSGLSGKVFVGRPGSKGVAIPVVAAAAGQYEAQITFAGAGLWIVEIELGAYTQSWEVTVAEPAR